MVKPRHPRRRPERPAKEQRERFSVSLDHADHEALVALAAAAKPPLSLNYMINLAVQRLLADARDPQHRLTLTDPLRRDDR